MFSNYCFTRSSVAVATSGNVLQAGLQYGANTAVKNETGEYPLEYINSVEEKITKKFYVDFKNFIEDRIQASRRKLSELVYKFNLINFSCLVSLHHIS